MATIKEEIIKTAGTFKEPTRKSTNEIKELLIKARNKANLLDSYDLGELFVKDLDKMIRKITLYQNRWSEREPGKYRK